MAERGGPLRQEPWCSVPGRTMLWLQHRLARQSNDEIAGHYGVSAAVVRQAFHRTMAELRRRSRLRIGSVADLLALAALDRVPPVPLAAVPGAAASRRGRSPAAASGPRL